MIRLSLRQFRTQGLVAAGLLLLAAVLLVSTGSHIASLYDAYAKVQAACVASSRCGQVNINLGLVDRLLELIGTALLAVPGVIGAFWGAPLIARELEQGTHRLAWTQGVTRTRWLATKLVLVGAASVIATGLLSLMVTWWSGPIDRANMNRFDVALFGERNVTPLGYAAFGFVLGVTFGVLTRRTLPAMATTLGVFLGVRLAFTYLVRQHLLTPVTTTLPLASITQGFGGAPGEPMNLFLGDSVPNAWIYSAGAVDRSGHTLTPQAVAHACPALLAPDPAAAAASNGAPQPVPASIQDALQTCVTRLSATYHGVVTYQPASRYWPFQWYETGIFLAAALALAAGCLYWVRHRLS